MLIHDKARAMTMVGCLTMDCLTARPYRACRMRAPLAVRRVRFSPLSRGAMLADCKRAVRAWPLFNCKRSYWTAYS